MHLISIVKQKVGKEQGWSELTSSNKIPGERLSAEHFLKNHPEKGSVKGFGRDTMQRSTAERSSLARVIVSCSPSASLATAEPTRNVVSPHASSRPPNSERTHLRGLVPLPTWGASRPLQSVPPSARCPSFLPAAPHTSLSL